MGRKGSRWKIRRSAADRLMAYSVEEPNTGCWIWIGFRTKYGYGQIGIFDSETQTQSNVPAHRAAFEAWVGPVPSGFLVCHRCDNPACINPKHLFIGTNSDNMRDMQQKGRSRYARGEHHGVAKFTADVIASVRAALMDTGGKRQAEIAQRFGMAQSHVSRIWKGATWRHLNG